MATSEATARPELLAASDQQIEDAIQYADPMVLRAILYQLTGDPDVSTVETKTILRGYYEGIIPAHEEDIAMLRTKAADFLKSYRDLGAGPIGSGPPERLPTSLELLFGAPIPRENIDLYLEELALDPWARALQWQAEPDSERVRDFSVTIIGAGMGGLNAALQLKHMGIRFTVIEKNAGVGGTWHENRYPGARVDTPSRSYTHIFGVDFPYPNPYCPGSENERYFNWIADSYGLRGDIIHNTEVESLTWDEAAAMWEIRARGPEGERTFRSNVVITSVGFLNRPNIPSIEGADSFRGKSWHSARWPEQEDFQGKKIVQIGTGSTGYQMAAELALAAGHLTLCQRTPQWLFPVPGYRSPLPAQIGWLDRNLPFHTNFMRVRSANNGWFIKMTTIDPEFDDPHACSPNNKRARDACITFLESKISDPGLRAKMTPEHPVWSARAVVVDTEYSVLDAIQADNVTLVTSGIARITPDGIEDADGVRHDADIIVYATGFKAWEYLYPMKVTGKGGRTTEDLWAPDGARAYLGCMLPGFPNFFSIYGPNTNGGLPVATFHEMTAWYAMQCIEKLILEDKRSIEVREDAYWRYNRLVDEKNRTKVWSDPRAHNYYWQENGRSATMNPFTPPEMWHSLRKPDFDDHIVE
jgi:4-hydroxyacetophenone monooxygenase